MEAKARNSPRINCGPRFNQRLGIITHVPHWQYPDGAIWAYEPYVREIRLWADLFAEVKILAPAAEGPIQGNQACYGRSNIVWRNVSYSLSYARWAPLKRLTQMPALSRAIQQLIRESDLIHLRSPGHPALLGQVLVRLLHKPSITKWAGLFDSFEGERWPSRIERRLIGAWNAGHPALIYGPSDQQSLISFLPALMSERELATARELSASKKWDRPWRFLSVGRLLPVKNFDLGIRGLGELKRQYPGCAWEYTIIGDGPDASRLRELACECRIEKHVHFKGPLPFAEVQNHYAAAQIVIMPGVKEGWPKIIAEAWAHGAIPVAADAGLVRWILNDESYGVPFQPTSLGLSEALATLLSNDVKLEGLLKRIAHRAEELSLERFKTSLEEVLVQHCGLK
ncbi:MAG TPA: glycosyltransferase family 4 protein [Pyrinomonadaceae bacterium]|nr:glycosyltransferase family 4 protein [Pyrinomonadaceae bacterium]